MKPFVRTYILLFLLMVAFPSSSFGQNINVTASFDTTRILIGDQINFSIIVDQPSSTRLSMPLFRDTLVENIEILSGPQIDTVPADDGRIRITGKYLVTSFDTGLYRITPVFAELNDENGIKRYYSDYSILEVARVKITPPDTSAKIFDIVAPYRAPVTLGEILPWLLIIIVAAAIAWLVMKYLKTRQKSAKADLAPLILEPAHVIAFRELEKLRDEQLWQKGEVKGYYSRLTEIVRQYLENRYDVDSLEMTTSDTLRALERKGLKKDRAYNILKSVLTGADLVKFAKYKPDPVENDMSYNDSWEFVETTRQQSAGPEMDGPVVKEGGSAS